jgi:hypothetical protein
LKAKTINCRLLTCHALLALLSCNAGTISISQPESRSLFQRAANNTGSVLIAGSYEGTPDHIEARAIVMAGAGNSGTGTDWQTLSATPTGGIFSGSLIDIPAGGWYQIETRSVTEGIPDQESIVIKIGIGDIYVTAGQSNATNSGNPLYTPIDDRVCARTTMSGTTWRHGYDPLPVTDGSSAGSVWSRLGDKLAAADNIPIGFICAGWKNTQTSQWLPGLDKYANLKTAIQSFPPGGFRAVLWHQGESDSVNSVSADTYASRLNTIIAQSRIDAGWSIPWYVAEASFHPGSLLSQEEPVAAGQRAVVYADPLVYFGPTTDAFHIEDANGGKLIDAVHFNAAGLTDHSDQWRDILRDTTSSTPRNGDFEENRMPSITGLSALADGAQHSINVSTDFDSASVIGWRVLTTDGKIAVRGSGFHNPTIGTYAGAIDNNSDGVLQNMAGRHVAFLSGGSPFNCFLQTTRTHVQPNSAHTMTAAIGVRDNSSTFGGARLDILADGIVVATSTVTKSSIDAIRGSESSGTFTEVSVRYVSGAVVTPRQTLSLRIAKVGGGTTVLDFDNVRFSIALTGYAAFQSQYWGGSSHPDGAPLCDPDGDGLGNFIEYAIGGDPLIFTAHPVLTSAGANHVISFTKSTEAANDPKIVYGFETSNDLLHWTDAAPTLNNLTTVTCQLPGSQPARFIRMKVTMNP